MKRYSLSTIAAALILIAAHAAWAGPIQGEGRLRGKSLADATILIDQTLYHVTPNTRIQWADGDRVTLTSLPAAELPDRGGEWPLIHARFRGQSSGAGAVLDSVELTYGHE